MSGRLSAAVKPKPLSARNHHDVSRFTFGVDAAVIKDVRTRGSSNAWFDAQLRHTAIEDSAAGAVASWFPRLSHSPGQAWVRTRPASPSSP